MKPVQTYSLHARFNPDGPDVVDRVAFSNFWTAANNRVLDLRKKELSDKKAQFAKLQSARQKIDPLVIKVLHDEMPAKLAGQKAARLVPDKKILRQVFNTWKKAEKTTPQQIAKRRKESARHELEIKETGRFLKAQEAILNGFTTLFEAAMAGDARAAKNVVEMAIHSAALPFFLEAKHPEVMKSIAKAQTHWPVLASEETGWEKKVMQRLEHLELGSEMRAFKIRFRQPRGAEINLPARLWAKAAVRTIEETRLRYLLFAQLLRGFGSVEALTDFCMKTGWDSGKQPDWISDITKLDKFSNESLPQWKRAVRKIIREQLPEFHLRPEWNTQRNTAEASGRKTPGEIKNAILDDITSALERLVPNSELPKSAC